MGVPAMALFSVSGQVAIITGGGTGLGAMVARTLANNGVARVYVVGRRLDRLAHLVISLESLAAYIKAEMGHNGLQIAYSGVAGPLAHTVPPDANIAGFTAFALGTSMEEFYTHVSGKLHGSISHMCSSSVPCSMRVVSGERRDRLPASGRPGSPSSQVILTKPVAAYTLQIMSRSAYTSSKAACISLCKTSSSCRIRWHVGVNSLAPEFFPSEMAVPLLKLLGSEPSDSLMLEDGEIWKLPKIHSTKERAVTGEDMADTRLWLASWARAFVNGNMVVLDGGTLGTVLPRIGSRSCDFNYLLATRSSICANATKVLEGDCVLVQCYRENPKD